MTDQELIVSAAKAVGFIYDPADTSPDGTLIGRYKNEPNGPAYVWNPLTDINDAIDLACRLSIKIQATIGYVLAQYGALVAKENYSTKNVPAVCRVVTRCAAEISKHLP